MFKGLGFIIALITQAVFGTLKLAGVIGWSWWWVTSPAWVFASLVIVIVGAIILLSGAIVATICSSILK